MKRTSRGRNDLLSMAAADLLAQELDSIADEELADDFPGSARIVRNAAEMLRRLGGISTREGK